MPGGEHWATRAANFERALLCEYRFVLYDSLFYENIFL